MNMPPLLNNLPCYHDIAAEIAATGTTAETFYPLGYPVLLAPWYWLAGDWGIIVAQAVMYAVAAVFAWRRFGWMGAAVVALHPYALTGIIKVNDNAASLPILVALLAMWTPRKLMGTRWTGLLIGLLTAIRPNGLILAAMSFTDGTWRIWRFWVYLVIGYLVLTLPVGRLYCPSNGPYNLMVGNNAGTREALVKNLNAEQSMPVRVEARPAIVLTTAYVVYHPVDALVNTALKAWVLCGPDTRFLCEHWWMAGIQWALSTMFGLGIVLLLLSRSWRPLAVVGLYALPFILTNADPRFRLPLIDIMVWLPVVYTWRHRE